MKTTRLGTWTGISILTVVVFASGLATPAAAAGPTDGTVVIRPLAALGGSVGTPNAFILPDATTNPDGTLTFRSADLATHRPADIDDTCFNTGNIASTGTATVDLTTCGASGTVIDYECEIHTTMTGKITIA